MVIVKILGGIDLASSIVFLFLIFGVSLPYQFLLFPAMLLFMKGLFVLMGDALSVLDIFASIILLLAIFITMPPILLWIPTFLLLAKGIVSFI